MFYTRYMAIMVVVMSKCSFEMLYMYIITELKNNLWISCQLFRSLFISNSKYEMNWGLYYDIHAK